MEMSTRKTIWWYALATGAGGTLLFGYACLIDGPPSGPERILYLWPLITIVLSAVATLRLRSCYRKEPGPGRGFWQLSVSDLLLVAFVCGTILSLFKAFWPDVLIKVGIPLTIVTGLLLLTGTLVAT